MICPAFGAAVTMVLGVASGAGVGESVRNSGWMCASLMLSTLSVGLVVPARLRLGAGLKERLRRRVFLGGSRSRGKPGDGDREVVGEAGMVSRKRGRVGVGEPADSTAWRDWKSTVEVSQESKLSGWMVEVEEEAGRWVDDREEGRCLEGMMSLVLEVMGRTLWVREERMEFVRERSRDEGGDFESMEDVSR